MADALTAAPSSEWVESGQTPTYVSGTQFTVPTDLTTKFEVNRRIQAELTAGTLVYSHVTSSSFAGGVTTVNLNDSVLTSALSKVWYSFWGTGSDRAYPAGLSPIPAGTQMFFGQAAAPTGWTQDTDQNDRVLRVVSGTGAGTGGTWTTSHTHTYTGVVNHVHSVDPPSTAAAITDPGHRHDITRVNDAGTGTLQYLRGINGPATEQVGSATTGITASVDIAAFNSADPTGGVATGTTAGQSVNADSAWRPAYFDIIKCTLN